MECFLVTSFRRYYQLESPNSHNSRHRWPLLIALHGYQGDKDSMMRVARRIGNGKMVVISLQGPHQFFIGFNDPQHRRVGFSWGTTWKMEDSIELHHSNLLDLIKLAGRKYQADPSRVFLLAFSQACSFNYRFVFTHPRIIRGAIAVCGGIPADWDESPRYQPALTHVLHIAATRDRWYTQEKNLEFKRKLAQRAASVDFRFYDSPHRFPRNSIPHIRHWIESHI
jgi:predicted esterase